MHFAQVTRRRAACSVNWKAEWDLQRLLCRRFKGNMQITCVFRIKRSPPAGLKLAVKSLRLVQGRQQLLDSQQSVGWSPTVTMLHTNKKKKSIKTPIETSQTTSAAVYSYAQCAPNSHIFIRMWLNTQLLSAVGWFYFFILAGSLYRWGKIILLSTVGT